MPPKLIVQYKGEEWVVMEYFPTTDTVALVTYQGQGTRAPKNDVPATDVTKTGRSYRQMFPFLKDPTQPRD